VLLFYVALIVFTGDEHPRTKALEILFWLVLPAVVFFIAAVALQRGVRNVFVLCALGLIAGVCALVLLAFTWGFVLPIKIGLLIVAAACFSRALPRLSPRVDGGEGRGPGAQR
jgi:hypothetical protein